MADGDKKVRGYSLEDLWGMFKRREPLPEGVCRNWQTQDVFFDCDELPTAPQTSGRTAVIASQDALVSNAREVVESTGTTPDSKTQAEAIRVMAEQQNQQS